MNILFLTLVDIENIEGRDIYSDLLRKFYSEGHSVYIVSPVERRKHQRTKYIKINNRLHIVKLKIGNVQKANIFEKGISTLSLEPTFISAIKKYYSMFKFDLVLYSTPPITLQKAVNFVKKRDKAVTYLLLKDIFPQNAVDLGMLTKKGIKGLLYNYFRQKEIKLYNDSDYIGCMSEANVNYVKKHNPYIREEKIEICPNCIEPMEKEIDKSEIREIRKKLKIPSNKVLFIYGGNLGKPQGIPFLIECLKSAKSKDNVFFLIVGSGTEYGKLKNFIKEERPKNVKVIPELPVKEYESIILAADVGMIFLDYRFTIPNFPSRLLSYMQAGLPVISVTDRNTDIGKIVEKGEFGISVRSNDKKAFLKAVDRLAEVEDLQFLGRNAKKFLLDNYTVQQNYDIIMKHFE